MDCGVNYVLVEAKLRGETKITSSELIEGSRNCMTM